MITSFTSGVVSQVIGLIFKAGFKDLKYILKKGNFNELKKKETKEVDICPTDYALLCEIKDLLMK